MVKLWRVRWRRTTLLFTGYVGVLLGLGAARSGLAVSLILVALAAGWTLMVWRRHSLPAVVAILFLSSLLGVWRGETYMRQLKVYQSLSGSTVTVTVTALDDATYGSHSQFGFTGGHVVVNGQALRGKMQVSGFGLPAVYQGDRVAVTGKLFLGQGAYQGRMSYAKLELLARQPSLVGIIRQKFAAGMQTALPEPLASFAMGLLIGQRTTLPDDVKQDLLMVGLTHIVAVSGYNLTIMLRASQRLLGQRSKRIGALLSLTLMAAFVLLAGGSASIIRAAIVSMLSISANYYGRRFKATHLICLAAAISGWANPFYLWGDLSWYLSFLAFYGVMVVAPLFMNKLSARWHESILVTVGMESVAAEIMTMPLILYAFGQMSWAGLPANLLVVSLVPLAMLLSFAAGLAGMFISPFAGWVAWPAVALLNYMLDTAHLVAGWPHVFLQNLSLSLLQMLGIYTGILAMVGLIGLKTRRVFYAKITDKNEWTQQMVNY